MITNELTLKDYLAIIALWGGGYLSVGNIYTQYLPQRLILKKLKLNSPHDYYDYYQYQLGDNYYTLNGKPFKLRSKAPTTTISKVIKSIYSLKELDIEGINQIYKTNEKLNHDTIHLDLWGGDLHLNYGSGWEYETNNAVYYNIYNKIYVSVSTGGEEETYNYLKYKELQAFI